LGQIRDPRAVAYLIPVLKDVDPDVRLAAVRALGKIEDSRSVEPLISVLQDKRDSVRNEAEWILKRLTGEDPGKGYENWKRWWDSRSGSTQQ